MSNLDEILETLPAGAVIRAGGSPWEVEALRQVLSPSELSVPAMIAEGEIVTRTGEHYTVER